ncbi:hypothetical protein NQ318_023275 [Aromia moschata]|uniref:Mos1 transposase HTH domain-containing protein n=1 Tax=Aromia moschata TaxID=1265417 RepID=A0AAV8Y4K7_9CUCU|nr:hypothetical protein NQ318_023275 [Aromia moschata]
MSLRTSDASKKCVQMEQRVNLKFLFKLWKTFTEAIAMLKEVYGNKCLSRRQVFEWFRRYKEGRETTDPKDDPRPGRPLTSKTDENIENCSTLEFFAYRRKAIEAIPSHPIGKL